MKRLTLADALLLATVCIWGLNGIVVKVLLEHFPPLALSIVRFVVTTAAFGMLVPARERTVTVRRRDVPLLVAAGLCGIGINQVAFTYGLEHNTVANITLLMATIPIFAGLGAWLLGWERVSWHHWIGLAMGFVGVAMIVGATPTTSGHGASLLGDLLGLLTAASWAGYSLMLRPLMRRYSPFRISLYVAGIGLLALSPFGVPQLLMLNMPVLPWYDWLLVLYSSLGAIVLTNVLWYSGIHRLGPSRATTYTYLLPVFGVIFAVMILGERPGALQILGGATIIAGIAFGRVSQAVDGPARELNGAERAVS